VPLPSAGLLVYREGTGGLEVLLVHPGGPVWARRDAGAWSIPKGEYLADEEPYAAARREFAEELGLRPPDGEPVALGEVRQRSGKVVVAWALPGNLDVSTITSNTCTIVWPPRSGREIEIPEVDRAEYFTAEVAREKLNPAQVAFVDRLESALSARSTLSSQ
jgi:predicted NUDIX family NTP pyrophosphohydrolase